MRVRVKFEPRDVWVGVFWNLDFTVWRVYVCIVPCFPICFAWFKRGCK